MIILPSTTFYTDAALNFNFDLELEGSPLDYKTTVH